MAAPQARCLAVVDFGSRQLTPLLLSSWSVYYSVYIFFLWLAPHRLRSGFEGAGWFAPPVACRRCVGIGSFSKALGHGAIIFFFESFFVDFFFLT